jgi:hypothetical protein
MRTWIVPALALLLGGCAPAAAADAAVPLTWTGDFSRGPGSDGRITLLLEEASPTAWTGTMYYEATEAGGAMPRATYRIEGVRGDDGMVLVHQKEILQADPLDRGRLWCQGTYELALYEGTERSALSGAYSADGSGCAGTTALQPADTF